MTRQGVVLAVAIVVLGALAPAPARAQTLGVRVEPDTVVLRDGVTPARVRVTGVDEDIEVRLAASLGRVEDDRFSPGDRRAPGWAIVVADSGLERAATRVRLVGVGALPTETKPRARVTVEIAGRRFGPVTADGAGRASVPVEVPPEATTARVIAVDEADLSTEREIALPASPWPRAVIMAPEALGVGEEGDVTVFALDPRGGWASGGEAPTLELPPGLVLVERPRPAGQGRWDGRVRAVATADQVEIGAAVQGERAVPARLRLQATPTGGGRLRRRAPSGPGGRAALGLRLGFATSLDTPSSFAAGVDFAWRFLRAPVEVAAVGGLWLASGSSENPAFEEGEDDERLRPVDYSLVAIVVGARAGVRLPARLRLETQLGVGVAFASSTYNRMQGMSGKVEAVDVSDTAPAFYVGGALARALGPGEAVIDVRWVAVSLDAETRVEPTAIGLWGSLGYRLVF